MAAYDIHRHFKALRADTGRRKGRSDPFATGFEDEFDTSKKESKKKPSTTTVEKPQDVSSQEQQQQQQVQQQEHPQSVEKQAYKKPRTSSPYVRSVQSESDDDDFLTYRPKRNTNRSVSPASIQLSATTPVSDDAARTGHILSRKPSRGSRALAVGNLAYLDDSSEEEERTTSRQRDRRPSPAPGNHSPGPDFQPLSATRSLTPGERGRVGSAISRHTVASPFAGTKYLQDSDSDSEEAIDSQRSGSQDSTSDLALDKTDSLTPLYNSKEVRRVDKPKSNGSGVSWRAFSAGRTEQRNAELQSLRTSLQKRGRSIAFESHVVTDDGQRIPLGKCCSNSKGLGAQGRSRSPPRTQKDIEPSGDELAEQEKPRFTTNPFSENDPTAIPMPTQHSRNLSIPSDDQAAPPESFQISESLSQSPVSEALSDSILSSTSSNAMTSSIDTLSRLTVAPQTIPEAKSVDHSLDLTMETRSSNHNIPSRNSSASRLRGMTSLSKRPPRRSTSTTSNSPAHAFLSSWHRESSVDADQPVETKSDDEGQSIGLKGEYIIGRIISTGGFGVVKEIHTRNEKTGQRESYAVKIVRKELHNSEADNDRAQQDLEHEVSVWRHLDHRHILRLRVVFETDYATFCIMDLNVGGTLHDLVWNQRRRTAGSDAKSRGIDSKLAKRYAYQLASALRYLHEDIKVCHRDVKLENCLVDTTTRDYDAVGGNLRLCDFGLADFLHSRSIDEERSFFDDPDFLTNANRTASRHNKTSSVIGTLEYASPKGVSVHRKLFETAGDVWAYGVIVYALCTGDLPFKHTMPSKTIDAILRADWDQNALRQASTSGEGDEVYHLVSGCLEKSIEERWTVSDCMDSPWFEGARDDAEGDESQIRAWQ